MAGRDDSAGSYGQWINPQDQSWLDYLGMKAADVGGGAYNALANITGALSPIGSSPEGNMAFQVPPMVTGLVDSAKRIGQRGGFTRVPELDEQLKQDLSNVVLSLYGGNALAGLTKPRGALGAGAMREAGEQPKGITAYHGSPHDFDKFSLDAIGTGEGAQAYGHGLYFADSEGVARSYRDALTGNHALDQFDYTVDGQTIGQPSPTLKNIVRDYGKDPQKFIEKLQPKLRLLQEKVARANAEDDLGLGFSERDLAIDELKQHQKLIDEAQGYIGKQIGQKPLGRMYQVRINADPESFLDWDKPLSQQSEIAKDAINRVGRDIQPYGLDRITEDMRLVEMNKLLQDPSAVSRLKEHGIPGIRYLDGNSRNAGAGSSNYVVFDDSLIEILKKYGIAAGAIGAGALAQPDQASAQDMPDWLKF